MKLVKSLLILPFLFIACYAGAQTKSTNQAIYSGVPWFDNRGEVVSAHGANLVKDNTRYYLFGENHSDTSNAFAGFTCYSSADLYNWKWEGMALPVQDSGRLGPHRVGERPKVMRCPKTGEYVMLMHTDSLGYKDPCIGYATAATITGPYTFRGPLLLNGKTIRKWDMGTFQDEDGSGYLLIHSGLMFKLSDDYKSVTEQVVDNKWRGSESPAVFKKDSIYYWLASDLTSWERNDNFYYTATSLKGPWTARGNFAPKGTLTWNSQTTFVLPVTGLKDTTWLFMGDRWSFPRQHAAATYVWQPLTVSGFSLSIPEYKEAWQLNTATGIAAPARIPKKLIANTDKKYIRYAGEWKHTPVNDSLSVSSADTKDASFTVRATGRQIGLYCLSGPDGGYAQVVLYNKQGKVLLTSVVDLYSKYAMSTLVYLTPVLPVSAYTLQVSVIGQRSNWSDKTKADYGSKGYTVALDKVLLMP